MAAEDTWRKAFKARILDELNMLDDEDPSNDMAGLHSLAITLLHLDDEAAAGALIAVLFMPLKALHETTAEKVEDNYNGEGKGDHDRDLGEKIDDLNNGNEGEEIHTAQPEERVDAFSEDKKEHNEQDQGLAYNVKDKTIAISIDNNPSTNIPANTVPQSSLLRRPTQHIEQTTINGESHLALSLDIAWIHECNGPCSIDYHHYTSLFVCKICLGTKFCGECLQLVKEEKLVCRDCSPQHSWYQAWPIPEGKAELVAEREGEKWIIRKEWLDALRAEWL